MRKLLSKYKEFVRFCIVGAFCTGIDAFVFYTLCTFVGYQLALVSGYVLSLIVNYFLTVYWTFEKTPNLNNAIGVLVAHLFNLFIIRMGLMWIFTSLLLFDDKIAYIPTLAISVITNFSILRIIMNKDK